MTGVGSESMSKQHASHSDRPILAVICNSLPPYRIHIQRRIMREIPELDLRTICTHENVSDRWGFRPPEDLNVISFGPGESSQQQGKLRFALHEWRKGGAIISWLRHHSVRAVLVEGYNDAGRLRLIKWLHQHRIPVFLFGDSNIRSDQAQGIKALAKRQFLRPILTRCSVVFPCGRLGRDFFVKYGADPDRIAFYPYEPDYALIDTVDEAAQQAARAKFDLDPQRRRLVYSGRLVDVKRVDLLIDAFVRVADERPEWDLILAGDGPRRHELEARVPSAMRHRVKFLGFIGDQAQLTAIYKVSDVLVLPSSYEPWALVINEAARSGLAIIASDVVGAAYELVESGTNGQIFRVDSLPDLTRAIQVTTDPVNLEAYKAASPHVLAEWIRKADPIDGLRSALTRVGVLS